MVKPNKLRKGDKIALIAPCSHIDEDRIPNCIDFFKSLELDVVLGESIYKRYGYLSGDDKTRAHDINKMFIDKSIKGIFAIRGGYGGARILDMLDYKSIKKNPKIFAGYSDVTCIHNVLNEKCNLITYHTPMAGSEFYKGVDEYTKNSFINLLFNDELLGEIKNPSGIEYLTLNTGKCKGKLCGGNLSVLVSSIGTKYEINTKNKILFIEDVEEPLYRIDRMLLQLKQSNKFKDAKGIIIGTFQNCIESNKTLSLIQIFKDLIVPENKPILYNLMCGHSLPCMSLPLGSKILLDTIDKKIIDLGI